MEDGFDAAGEFPDHLADRLFWGLDRHRLSPFDGGGIGLVVSFVFGGSEAVFEHVTDEAGERSALLISPVLKFVCDRVWNACKDFFRHSR
jgi:hypothetical protein